MSSSHKPRPVAAVPRCPKCRGPLSFAVFGVDSAAYAFDFCSACDYESEPVAVDLTDGRFLHHEPAGGLQ